MIDTGSVNRRRQIEEAKVGLVTLIADLVAERITPAEGNRKARRLYEQARSALLPAAAPAARMRKDRSASSG